MKRRQLIALAAMALVACVDGARSSGPNFAISDGTHGTDGNPFFHWLPPIVKDPVFSGEFNPFVDPEVTICELEGTSCGPVLAVYTRTTGVGSEVIRVSDNHYHVNWHTNLFDLSPDKFYRIAVRAGGELLGFADVDVGATGRELRNVDTDEFVPLVDGRTLPVKFRAEAGIGCFRLTVQCAEAIVSPGGGLVTVTNGGDEALAFAEFPDGWTDQPALVRIERIDDSEFAPGDGPLGTPEGVEQYPLFFEYFTTAPEPFSKKVRIGVCNIGASFRNAYHPPHRGTTALAMGGPGKFRILDFAVTLDLLGTCATATGGGVGGGGGIGLKNLDGWRGLLAHAGALAASAFAPRTLHAAGGTLLDGGMGGQTDEFTPAGTVDTGFTLLPSIDLLAPLATTLILQNVPDLDCSLLQGQEARGLGYEIRFDWADVAGAASYDIVARHADGSSPILDATTTTSQRSFVSCNSFVVDTNLEDWQWTVTARSEAGEAIAQGSGGFAFAPCRRSGGFPCATGPAGQLDQQQTLDPAAATLAIDNAPTSEQKLAQVVTVGAAGSLFSVGVPVTCGSGALTVEIQGVTDVAGIGIPNGTVLTSRTLTASTFTTATEFTEVVFPDHPAFSVGDRFAIVLRNATGSCGVGSGPLGNPYAGGHGFFDARPNLPGWVLLGARDDLPFMTFMR